MTQRLVFDVSSHGFGHFAQTAAVVNAVSKRLTNNAIIIRSKVPESLARQRVKTDFELIYYATDFGMLMDNTLDVDIEKSFAAYEQLHQQLDQVIAREANVLAELSPDFLLSNVSYVSIAAAKTLDIPVVGFCSLNWADIFSGYCKGESADRIYDQMVASYNLADLFICPQPSMAMPSFSRIRSVSPIASIGKNQRALIEKHYPATKNKKWVIVSPGGIPTKIELDTWPRIDDVFYIIAWHCDPLRDDMVCLYDIPFSYIDILASCDAVLTKPGYGTVSEAMCNRLPMLYVRRRDWPEESFLVEWMQQFGKIREVEREVLFNGRIEQDLHALLTTPWRSPQPLATGADEVAEIIAELVS